MTITRMLDLKHGITDDGKLVKVLSNGDVEEISETEPVILFRARDKLAPRMLHYYFGLCQNDGVTEYQLRSMKEMIQRFEDWASMHITKQPGITQGAKWGGTRS